MSELSPSVAFKDCRSECVFVVFNPMNWDIPADKSPWGKVLFDKLNISCVYVTSRAQDWYCSEEKSWLEKIKIFTDKHRYRIGYGYSMGAYAALKFSRLLELSHVLALSPQISIAPLDVHTFDERYASKYDSQKHSGMCISSTDISGECHVYYDPDFHPDRSHAKFLGGFGVYLHELPGFSHETINAFKSSQLFSVINQSIIANGTIKTNGFLNALRESYKTKPEYIAYVALRLKNSGRLRWATSFLQKYFQNDSTWRGFDSKNRAFSIILSIFVHQIYIEHGVEFALKWLEERKMIVGSIPPRPYEILCELVYKSDGNRALYEKVIEIGVVESNNPYPLMRKLAKVAYNKKDYDKSISILENCRHAFKGNQGFNKQFNESLEARIASDRARIL